MSKESFENNLDHMYDLYQNEYLKSIDLTEIACIHSNIECFKYFYRNRYPFNKERCERALYILYIDPNEFKFKHIHYEFLEYVKNL
uniref:Uncharacterized protein n=1 Tax=viral metagenome TaxID=1070528 RepID=A0A6C0AES5_9ZZZZ